MSDFFTPAKTVTAKKSHRCTYCGQQIGYGDEYQFQKGNYDGRWFVTKMHSECFDEMCETGEEEYTPYSNERPEATA